MRFSHTNTYPAGSTEVLAMLTDRDFRERVCAAQRALDHTVEVEGSGVGARVRVTRSQSMQGAPSFATKLTGDSVQLVQSEHWTRPEGAEFSLEIPGKPGSLHGGIELRELGATTTEEVFTGELKVSVPLVGPKLEQLVASILTGALRREGEVGRRWLAEHTL